MKLLEKNGIGIEIDFFQNGNNTDHHHHHHHHINEMFHQSIKRSNSAAVAELLLHH